MTNKLGNIRSHNVTIVDVDSADVTVDAGPNIDVDNAELLRINGTDGGDDTLNYLGFSSGNNRTVFTPG